MAKNTGKIVLWHSAMAGAAAAALAAWRWQRRWGATAAEQRAVLPGDSLVPQPLLQATRAIGIDAPPEAVWPWLAQLGYGKAGFYSYDWLQRGAGLGIVNADQINPEWQDPQAGDQVSLAEGVALMVAEATPPQAFVLVGTAGPDAPPGLKDLDFTWAFILEPEGPAGTRLVARERYAWLRWRSGVAVKAIAWISFVMSRAMLLGIRARAESAWLGQLEAKLDDAVDVLAASAAPADEVG
ncbi:MAG: hypothetical protein LBS27_12090 [Bifidobacteriaceae bacterium]|jgi:hypothetical protein|nr:hypothetical protein [Bifidobacteriaceae bacterium]